MGRHRDCLERFTCYVGQPDRKAEFPRTAVAATNREPEAPVPGSGCDWKCSHLVACPKKSSVPLGSTP